MMAHTNGKVLPKLAFELAIMLVRERRLKQRRSTQRGTETDSHPVEFADHLELQVAQHI
jgi:hypothetical protein